jgi:hypothetical protein
VARVVEFVWRTPPPTSVDEQLVIYDDGTACLVVRKPRTPSPSIGSYICSPDAAELELVGSFGPGTITIDLLHPPGDQRLVAAWPTLERLHDDALEHPEAIATFHAGAPATAAAPLSLLVVAAGQRPVQFELNPASSALHFSQDGQPIAWREFPEIHTGFITPNIVGLGGLRSPAVVEPGAYGAIALDVRPPDGADTVSIQVAGWLRAALPDEEFPRPFEVRTAGVAIGR